MKIDHAALYVQDLEAARAFFERHFDARANEKYHNPHTGLETYFLSFAGEARLEIMTRPGLPDPEPDRLRIGYVHLAFAVGGRERVDELAGALQAAGFPLVSGPRVTGDGYYEACVLGPGNSQIEIVA